MAQFQPTANVKTSNKDAFFETDKRMLKELAKKYQESMRNFVNDFGQPQFTEVFKTVDPKLANEIFKAYVDFNNSMINLINKLNK